MVVILSRSDAQALVPCAGMVDLLTDRSESEVLAILAVSTDPVEITAWLTATAGAAAHHQPPPPRWPPSMAASVARWDRYTHEVEHEINGGDAPTTTTFGACVRCGSKRLVVTTKQLRRADDLVIFYSGLSKKSPGSRV